MHKRTCFESDRITIMNDDLNHPKHFDSREKVLLLIVLVTACAARISFLVWGYTPELVYGKYLSLSRTLFTPEWWNGHVFFSSPGYQFFLAVLDRCLGMDAFTIRAFQALVGGIHCVILALIMMKLFTRTAGFLTGMAAAVYEPFVLHDCILATSVLDLVINAMLVLFFLKSMETRRIIYYFFSGFMLGLACIVRPNALMIAFVGLAFYIVFPSIRKNTPISIKALIAAVIGLGFPILPVTICNRLAGGEWVMITASAGNLLYSGNSYYANGLTYSPPESMLFMQNQFAIQSDNTLPVEHLMFWETAKEFTGKDLTASESNKFWTDQTLSFMAKYPSHAVKLLALKALYFWNSYASHDIAEIQLNEHNILKWPLLTFNVIIPFGIAGIVLMFISGIWRRAWILCVPVASYWIGTIIVFSVDRYRLPAFPFVIAIAVWSLGFIFGKIKKQEFLLPVVYLFLTAGAFLFIHIQTYDIRYSRDLLAPLFEYEHRGIMAMKRNDLDAAEMYFRKMIELDPGSAQIAHWNLANIARRRGNAEEAQKQYRYAQGYSPVTRDRSFYEERIQRNSKDFESILALGCIEWAEGNKNKALEDYNKAVSYAPWWPAVHFNRAIALLYADTPRPAEALDALSEAYDAGMKFSPNAADIHYHKAVALMKLDRKSEAVAELKESLREKPDNTRALNLLEELSPGE